MWDDEDDDNSHSFSIGKEPTYFYRVYESVTHLRKRDLIQM